MFTTLATRASQMAGSAQHFLGCVVAFGVWLVLGMALGWSEAIHLWPTSLLTWLTYALVILLQHSQTRQEAAMQAKLDELIHAVDAADNRLIGLEKQPRGTVPPVDHREVE